MPTDLQVEPTVLVLDNVFKRYGDVDALRGVSLTVRPREFLAIVGPSGSGKSTLLNIMGTLDRPTSGTVNVAGRDIARLSDNDLSQLRAASIGFVFQHFHLSAGVSAVENVANGLLYLGVARKDRLERAKQTLHLVGLSHRVNHRPHELSGGEKQRVAIARALVSDPAILLADEPTGALDSTSGAAIMALLRNLNESGVAIVLITHDLELAASLPRQALIRDGVIAETTRQKASDLAEAISRPHKTEHEFESDESSSLGRSQKGASR